MADKYIDQALDSFSSNVLNKLDPLHHSGQTDYSKWYPMNMHSPQVVNDLKNPSYEGLGLGVSK